MHPNAVLAQEAIKKEYGQCILFVVAEGYMFQVPQKAPKEPLMHVEDFKCPDSATVLKNIKTKLSPKTGSKPKGKTSGRGKAKRKEEKQETGTEV